MMKTFYVKIHAERSCYSFQYQYIIDLLIVDNLLFVIYILHK